MAKTDIGWSDWSWNPLRYRTKYPLHVLNGRVVGMVNEKSVLLPAGTSGHHCEKISPGCAHCYSCAMNARKLSWGTGLDYIPQNTEHLEAYLDEEAFAAPLRWKRPRMVFPFSMTDLFGAWVPQELQLALMERMEEAQQHTFQVLTKRPEIAVRFMEFYKATIGRVPQNVWIGTSVENKLMAEQRMPWLIVCPAAKLFVSYEPALELVDFKKWLPYIHWLIIGGESGAGARPFNVGWAEDTIEDCAAANVPLWVKQMGSKPRDTSMKLTGKGDNPEEWYIKYRVQQMPEGFQIKPKAVK